MPAITWVRGRIFTGRRLVEAVSAEDGRVVASGRFRTVRRSTATGAERVDLGGRLAVPGLTDSHLHLSALARASVTLDLTGCRSIVEMGRKLRAWSVRHPNGPVVGAGWDQERLRERRYPTAIDLQRWAPDRPVVLERVCRHASLVSEGVLAEVGIDGDTPDPPGGRIGRDATGRPNGLLFDNALESLRPWSERAFPPTARELERLLDRAASFGLTTLAPMSASASEAEALGRIARRRRLPARLAIYLRAEAHGRFVALRRRAATGSTRLVGLKVVADGAFGPRTAWLRTPYRDRPKESGFRLLSEEALTELAVEAERLGAGLAVHAIGDRALLGALRVFARSRPTIRPRVEHASLIPPDLLARLDRVRPHLVVQPGFVPSDAWIVDRLGARRARYTYPFRTLLAHGHAPVASSDAPVEPLDPWVGIAAAMAPRRTGAPESVDAASAIRMYSENAAAVLGWPGLGSLEVGGVADLVECGGLDLTRVASAGASRVRRVWREGARVGRRRGAGER
ncbi:MAG TPA: amidohydrolase [Thermoplasmata archaeon]|nr:amidohydrolase [Thermoplasmata archaeon]